MFDNNSIHMLYKFQGRGTLFLLFKKAHERKMRRAQTIIDDLEDEVDPQPPVPLSKRGKFQAKKNYDSAHMYPTIQMKLNKILYDPFSKEISSLLDNTSYKISLIVYEAYLLANFHFVRMLREGKDLPELTQSFFASCCYLVAELATKAGQSQPNLRDSAEQYRLTRPNGWMEVGAQNLGGAIASASREMKTMAENHIVVNLLPRLVRYVRLKYSLSDNRTAELFIRCAFMDKALTEQQQEFKAWIDFNPCFENQVRKHLCHFIKKLADVLEFYQGLDANTKGVCFFSLLPLKGSYVQMFFVVDPTTLPELLNLLPRDVQKQIITKMLEGFPDEESDEAKFLLVRKKARASFNRDFQKLDRVKYALWRCLFNVKQFETQRRKFASILSTNGYAVTVSMHVPKAERLEEGYDPSSVAIGKEAEFDQFIGIDPGGTYVCTAFNGDTCKQVSTKELRHHSKMNERTLWDVKQRKYHVEYSRTLEQLPSLKTASFDQFRQRVRETLTHAQFLFWFSRRPVFRS